MDERINGYIDYCISHTSKPANQPIDQDLEGVLAEDLKERAKVGYRGDRILRLAQSFRDGSVDPHWLEAPERSR